ncbi:restriction endonuclease subunit S [Geobacillus sp. FSL K6-0789]|uniref:Restriction endonuclease subunit S n=2 Tax=Geobacillus stearothermophilus TaxID=1422 RepID=A0A178TKE8_GEOSE|nr:MULTISPECIES: restriction endonuclease subunit S [Geobacillus]MBR2515948.1 restriction endonuclease subunit S [Geobacillus sp.]MED5077679.1 restriction endonuclease subunit S [Geobacillus stearothermophilus]OAO81823.1 Type I restriction-modification system specificity subunit S [Geobacillus stearothermophilus]RLP99845.1 restriction endonuclease subunit S [Geobacillus stearothermophilus]RLQ07915.1 restriction endonuclease subunit S [Geobacillus stearothermophilus]
MGFETVKLKDLTINLDNKRKPLNELERKSLKKKGLYPYCGANGVLDYIDEFIFDQEILCIAEDGGSWGFREKCAYIMNEPCWVNNHAHVLVAKENVNVKYLCYYLNYADLSKHITGTTRGKLTKSALEKIEVKIPDYSTQNKIVNALDKSQELIDKRKAQIEALDQLTQSVFLEMFGDPVSNPKGWDVKKLKDIAEIEDGDRGENYPKQHELVSEGILFLSTSNFVNNKLDLSKVTYITKEKFSQLRKGKLRRGDLIVTLRGSIGNIVIFDEEGYDTGFINAQMAILRLKNVNRIFFQQLYTSNSFQLVLKKTQTGSSQPQLPLKNLKELEIIIPPLELQELFAATIQQINLKKELLLKSQAEIQNMFNSLMQRAFKGELFND